LSKISLKKFPLTIILLLFGLLLNAQSTFKFSSPESQGISTEKLSKLKSEMHQFVDNNEFSAIQTAIVKNGKLIYFENYGFSEISSKKGLDDNDIFRIASMTKPIVSVGLMILYEQGKFNLNDPVHKFIPEFKNLKIKKGKKINSSKNDIKIIDILRHSAGLEFKGPESYLESISLNLEEFIKKSIKDPLIYEPGTQWRYS